MMAYQKDGEDFFLLANTRRGVMKFKAADLDQFEPITAPTGIAGVPYETLWDLAKVYRFEMLDQTHALALQSNGGGGFDLKTLSLP